MLQPGIVSPNTKRVVVVIYIYSKLQVVMISIYLFVCMNLLRIKKFLYIKKYLGFREVVDNIVIKLKNTVI